MKHLIFILNFYCFSVLCQTSINPIGGDINQSNGSVAFTIGQISYQENNTSQVNILEGAQQPYEVFTLSSFNHSIVNDIIIFPNPTSDGITLDLTKIESQNMEFVLLDPLGQAVNFGKIIQGKNTISLSTLPSGMYTLNLIDSKFIHKSYKVIKN